MVFESSSYQRERESLVESLKRQGILRSEVVIRAMLKVKREEYLPPDEKEYAYVDSPLPIGQGRTISAPHMVSIMNEALELHSGLIVLEIGAGSGYHAATIAEIVAPKGTSSNGHVYTVEIVPELAEFARDNIERTGYGDRVTIIEGDGSLGYMEKAPYERIIVTAAAPSVPQPLLEQLKNEGLMVIPVGGQHMFQTLLVLRKDEHGKVDIEDKGGCAFVPLTGKHGHKF
jgi:protein-L-isoaspartate(D-aspartate) O-methyltransferase